MGLLLASWLLKFLEEEYIPVRVLGKNYLGLGRS